jgi:hypothetical protein
LCALPFEFNSTSHLALKFCSKALDSDLSSEDTSKGAIKDIILGTRNCGVTKYDRGSKQVDNIPKLIKFL